MGSDRAKLEKLLTKFGVGFIKEGDTIVCEEGGEKITGYSKFCTIFQFNTDGEFDKMGAWSQGEAGSKDGGEAAKEG